MKTYKNIKNILSTIIIAALLNSCEYGKNEKQIHKKIDSSNNNAINTNEEVLIYESDCVKVFADSSFCKGKISYSSIKFEPYINFKDFKTTEIYRGNKAKIDYTSNSLAKEYKTLLTEEYAKENLNFGGHYCFISWDCGAPCMMSTVIDLKDGKVYNGLTAPLGFKFEKDSRMVIANPPDSASFYDDCEYCHPEIWIWDEQAKKFNEIKP